MGTETRKGRLVSGKINSQRVVKKTPEETQAKPAAPPRNFKASATPAPGLGRALAGRWPEAEHFADLGTVLAEQAKYREAATVFGRAAELAPGLARAWAGLASSLANLNQFRRAEFCYRRALELDPDSQRARTGLGNVLLLEARIDEARAEFERNRASAIWLPI
jgi:tetratricopeptide (TPR) repeat protein